MKTLGAIEVVNFPDLGIDKVRAKIDTGAFTGALHATSITEAVKGEKRRLSFVPLGKGQPVTVRSYYRRFIKSSSGHVEERYCIPVNITIRGKKYLMNISLTDRSSMRYPVIIGRRFIKEVGFVVDVTRSAQYGAGSKE